MTGVKKLKSTDSHVPSVDSLAAPFGKKSKKSKKPAAQPEVELLKNAKLHIDGDSELDKLASVGHDDDTEKQHLEADIEEKWGNKAQHLTLVPNRKQEEVKDWLLHPSRTLPPVLGGPLKKKKKKTVAPQANLDAVVPEKSGASPLQQLRHAHKAIQKATKPPAAKVAKVAKVVTARVQKTPAPPPPPLPSILAIHAGPLIVKHTPFKPEKVEPLKAAVKKAPVQPAVVQPKVQPPAKKTKDKPDGRSEFEKMESMASGDSLDPTSTDAEIKTEEEKVESDDDDDHHDSWLKKIIKDPDSAVHDSQDGEGINDFLKTEARALKKAGKHAASTKSVLDQQMAEQHDAAVVEHVTPFEDLQTAPAAPVTPKPQAAPKVAKASKQAEKEIVAGLPGLHDGLAAKIAKKHAEAAKFQASKGKSEVDDMIRKLGGHYEY